MRVSLISKLVPEPPHLSPLPLQNWGEASRARKRIAHAFVGCLGDWVQQLGCNASRLRDGLLQLPKRHIFAGRTLEPFWQLNSCLHDAFITVLRDITSSSTLSKHGKIFLGHKQPVLGQLWHLLFQIIHYFRVWDMVGQMSEKVPEHFRPQDLMNPYLGPSLSLQVDIAK